MKFITQKKFFTGSFEETIETCFYSFVGCRRVVVCDLANTYYANWINIEKTLIKTTIGKTFKKKEENINKKKCKKMIKMST